mmetsp:Transcript_68947/g.162242  ORF Transcript_68947/g.162242 Transcript_68947/m.162242 type:complete len:367 (+) Transcript_68947:296-1396(+)
MRSIVDPSGGGATPPPPTAAGGGPCIVPYSVSPGIPVPYTPPGPTPPPPNRCVPAAPPAPRRCRPASSASHLSHACSCRTASLSSAADKPDSLPMFHDSTTLVVMSGCRATTTTTSPCSFAGRFTRANFLTPEDLVTTTSSPGRKVLPALYVSRLTSLSATWASMEKALGPDVGASNTGKPMLAASCSPAMELFICASCCMRSISFCIRASSSLSRVKCSCCMAFIRSCASCRSRSLISISFLSRSACCAAASASHFLRMAKASSSLSLALSACNRASSACRRLPASSASCRSRSCSPRSRSVSSISPRSLASAAALACCSASSRCRSTPPSCPGGTGARRWWMPSDCAACVAPRVSYSAPNSSVA